VGPGDFEDLGLWDPDSEYADEALTAELKSAARDGAILQQLTSGIENNEPVNPTSG